MAGGSMLVPPSSPIPHPGGCTRPGARVDHVTGKKRDVQPVVEGEGVFTSAGESQRELDKVVAAARG